MLFIDFSNNKKIMPNKGDLKRVAMQYNMLHEGQVELLAEGKIDNRIMGNVTKFSL